MKLKTTGFILIISILLLFTASSSEDGFDLDEIDYRQEMRDFVQRISFYGKSDNRDFIIIPQNGQELLTLNGEAGGVPAQTYIEAIDGVGREDLFYGYSGDNKSTPADANQYMIPYLKLAEQLGIKVIVTDYCSSSGKMDRSYAENREEGFVSFAAHRRALDSIPLYPESPSGENQRDIYSLSDMDNFLYLINPEGFASRQQMIEEIGTTNYDLIIVDLFDNDGFRLTADEVEKLKKKNNGAHRLVIAYMSIGEVEDYRYYWRDEWYENPPAWFEKENPHWKGNYKVEYWDPQWQEIILGSDDAYLDKVLQSGFDGVYLDIIDAFDYFE